MNGNYHLNRFYAQERLAARYQEAENHRLARQGKKEGYFKSVIAAAARSGRLIGRVYSRAGQSLGKLGESRA
jgi:hypothetical protein